MTETVSRSPRTVIVAGPLGSSLEWYDFFLYSTAAAVVFDKPFFPDVWSGRCTPDRRSRPPRADQPV